MTSLESQTPAATTLYNGACPICRLEIGTYQSRCAQDGIALGWIDISRDGETLARLGLERDAVKRRLHVLDADGRMHVGVDAFLVLWRAMPHLRRLAALVGHPAVKPLARLVYDRAIVPALFTWNRWHGR